MRINNPPGVDPRGQDGVPMELEFACWCGARAHESCIPHAYGAPIAADTADGNADQELQISRFHQQRMWIARVAHYAIKDRLVVTEKSVADIRWTVSSPGPGGPLDLTLLQTVVTNCIHASAVSFGVRAAIEGETGPIEAATWERFVSHAAGNVAQQITLLLHERKESPRGT